MKTKEFSIVRIVGTVLVAAFVSSCSTVDMPKGKSKGYSTFRFVDTSKSERPFFVESSTPVNGMVENAITSEFINNGLALAENETDMIIGYLLIIQNNVTTKMIDNYFGYGRSSDDIGQLAHKKGVIKGKNPDNFRAGAIVIDLIDAETNDLVYRHYARRDMIENITDEKRQQRINEAVAEALAPFFR